MIDLGAIADLHQDDHELRAYCPRCDRWAALPSAQQPCTYAQISRSNMILIIASPNQELSASSDLVPLFDDRLKLDRADFPGPREGRLRT